MQVNSKSLIDRYGDKLKCKQAGGDAVSSFEEGCFVTRNAEERAN